MNLILAPEHIHAVSPNHRDATGVVAALLPVVRRYGIDVTPERLGMFLAQWAHESNFVAQSENLNYSAERLCAVWPGRFPTLASAQPYAGNPQALANRVYNGRMGNRPGSNHGWTYRGRGWPQLTGRDGYRAYGQLVGHDLEGNPNLMLRADVSAAVCGAFWDAKGLNRHADAGDMITVTRAINGGENGLEDRVSRYRRVIPLLRDQAAALATQADLVRPGFRPGRLFVNGVELDPATARIREKTITLPSGEHQITKRTRVGDKLYVETAS